ncbi:MULTISPECIES: HAD-IC family P-type ATPase [Gordonia]|uniref:Carbonate dehydratase n=1 Tax=Gordonia jacobaea TaxID=122202 RepID=A0ABR5IG40_9ACTN|nr:MULTISPECIES: HAD-IC family P-type ATPase [Gordonia]KNA92669.1 carbonate dehydratase [Gordonia jacobaea]OBC09928.1 carbonate dehydratase [Gordonia sp. 852002-50395_SCH5434458]
MTTTDAVLTDSHAVGRSEVLAALDTSAQGLTSADATRRLEHVGPNRLAAAKTRPAVLRFAAQFNNILIYILIGAGVLKAILGDWIDFAVIVAVAVINAVVGFVQEGRAESALAGIRNMLSLHARARRDGEWVDVDAENLVPGDVVSIRSGDRVPADIRLLEATNLRIEESALTGESVPASKDTLAVDVDAGIGDRQSMAYSSTIVSAGTGVGVVTATGPSTEIGRIQSMISDIEQVDTPLTQRLEKFGTQLSLGILGLAAAIMVIGKVIHNFTIDELISAAIGFAVAAIPEGLPAVVTITLALGVQQMARRHAITRKLPAVEALGSVSVICSDKTGTLTQNEMTVRTVVTGAQRYSVDGTGYDPRGSITADGQVASLSADPDLALFVETMALCNDARVAEVDGRWQLIGEPTEGALRTLALKAGFDADVARLGEVPFESQNKFMATLSDLPDGGRTILVKGAPDRLLDRSEFELDEHGELRPLDRPRWESVIDELSAQGLRVLAAARRPAPDADSLTLDDVDHGLTFLGVAGIVDPPRPEAITAIANCHSAGIRVKMITGDHAGTARAIAAEMGIIDDPAAPVLTGADLQKMSQTRLREVAGEVDIYARTSPEHKLRIVTALQAQGEIVAMTGDGVNDAPALTRADIGVAMGIKGTEATKEAAGIVLADDNFATIERAVEEGRRIYDNIRKSILFLLPTNGAQSLVILVAILFGFSLPLTPVQILWVNMITAVTLSLALVFEPAEPGIMSRTRRSTDGPLIARGDLAMITFVSILVAAAAISVYFVAKSDGHSLAIAQTAAVNMLALGQLAYLFNCRYLSGSSLKVGALRGNPMVWYTSAALIVLQLVFIYAPFMHTWFGSAPLTGVGWGVTIGLAIAIFFIIEIAKAVARRFESVRSSDA